MSVLSPTLAWTCVTDVFPGSVVNEGLERYLVISNVRIGRPIYGKKGRSMLVLQDGKLERREYATNDYVCIETPT